MKAHHGHHEGHHGAHHRARGGASQSQEDHLLAADEREAKGKDRWIDKEVEKEAEADGYGGHKRGGHVKKHMAKRKHGGNVQHHAAMHIDGKAAHHRMDRPKRKHGGGVGADMSPMTAAHKLTAPKGEHDQTKTDKRND